jgi:23S rRNA pseudouridine1911/1915/1917 synthase
MWLKKIDRQALHAKKLSFIHPESNTRVTFESALPDDMLDLWNELEADFNQ